MIYINWIKSCQILVKIYILFLFELTLKVCYLFVILPIIIYPFTNVRKRPQGIVAEVVPRVQGNVRQCGLQGHVFQVLQEEPRRRREERRADPQEEQHLSQHRQNGRKCGQASSEGEEREE